jgi:NADPH:quinone reductase-like Zn-dependent oxidoreductase
MRAVVIQRQAPDGPVAPQVDLVHDWPELKPPRPGWVHLRTVCSALNQMDLWVGRGIRGVPIEYPKIGGVDACAVVEDRGEGVDASWAGRKVIFNPAVAQSEPVRPGDPSRTALAPDYHLIGEHTQGTHAERFTAPVDNLVVVDEVDAPKAAAFATTFLTAYSMMITKAGLLPGQSVLIVGIGGGVATAALALARWRGCATVVTSRHASKLEKARALGADHGILDEGQDWSREVRAVTGRRGVDVAVDTVGGSAHLNCLKSLAPGGALTVAGATAGPVTQTHLAYVFWRQLRILGSTMGTNDELRELAALLRAGAVAPVVDSVYEPARARAAWERLEAGAQMGKIVLRWSDG